MTRHYRAAPIRTQVSNRTGSREWGAAAALKLLTHSPYVMGDVALAFIPVATKPTGQERPIGFRAA